MLTALPLPGASGFRTALVWLLETPLAGTSGAAAWVSDLIHFKRHANENRALRQELASFKEERFRAREFSLENARLVKLLELKQGAPSHFKKKIVSRVIARPMLTWDRVLLLDKGRRDGVRPDMLVLSDLAVIGKISEAGLSSARVTLINDPSFRLGVLLQRTREQGVLYGLSSKGSGAACRVKYISQGAQLQTGDIIETAGYGAFVPKGIRVGTVKKSFRIPGHIYQTAEIAPAADIDRAEEVMVVE